MVRKNTKKVELMSPQKTKTARAVELHRQADVERAIAAEHKRKGIGDWVAEESTRRVFAEHFDAQARELLEPDCRVEVHPAGEAVPGRPGATGSPADWISHDTLDQEPSQLAVDASHVRSDLLASFGSGAMELAMDAAMSIQPTNSLEKMLAHQMAVCHALGMEFALKAQKQLNHQGTKAQAEIASRLATTSARLMDSFQRGLQNLARIRRGGQQTVRVVHVHQNVAVGQGGQAVVAGDLGGGKSEGDHVKK